jgi:hypothetical protein
MTFLSEISRHFSSKVQHSLRIYGNGTLEAAFNILEEEDDLENVMMKKTRKKPQKRHVSIPRSESFFRTVAEVAPFSKEYATTGGGSCNGSTLIGNP